MKKIKRNTNPCGGLTAVQQLGTAEQFYKTLAWKPSTVALRRYASVLKQSVIRSQDGSATFDEDALAKLIKKYPRDPLYPLLGDQRQYQKLRSNYIGYTIDGRIIGGLRIGSDGLIHPELTHNPNTLRLACQNPNMQNLPVVGDADALETLVRNLVVASPGCVLLEADFAAIEAVLVGYFARDPDYIRLAKLGIHSYLASHILGRPADLSWSDADLSAYFGEIKHSTDQSVKVVYKGSKRGVHLSAYGGTPHKMVQAEPDIFKTLAFAEKVQRVYWDICPRVKQWQLQTQLDAHENGFLRNPFDYVLRFSHVFRNVKEGGQWVRKPGDQANEALAFLPQSTAAGIIKEAMLRLYFDRYEEAGQYLRLQVHDSLLLDVPVYKLESVRAILVEEMTRPVRELPLPASYEMGEYLVINVDTKQGERWGACH